MSQESMSREIALVRQWLKALLERDDSAFGLLSADVVYRPISTFADSRECRGPEEVHRFILEWWDLWGQDAGWEPDTVRVYGDAIVALLRFSGRARASGIQTVGGVFEVFRFRDGRISQIEDFTESREAIDSAGGAE